MHQSANRVPAAAGLILAAMLIIGFIDNFVRVIAEDAGLWQFHAVRSAMVLPVLGGLALIFGWPLRARRLWAVLIRSALMATSLLLYFGAVAVLPISTAGAGLFTSPIFVLVFSIGLFGARIGPWRAGAVAIGFAGVLLVLQPGGDAFTPVAIVPVLAGALYAAGSLATRQLCAEESPYCLTWWFFALLLVYGVVGAGVLAATGWGGAPGTASFFGTGWQPFTGQFLTLTVVQAAGSLVAVGFLVRAYQIADPSYASVFEYSFLLFAGIWGYVLWAELPGALAFGGICCILVAGLVIILRGRQVPGPGGGARRGPDCSDRSGASRD
ncbi:DMT family transporter [Dinoroseobacter sp. S375]|uniref:DMT family transporter n=1 Tax=Dinoroseobacter sp. S375 TaxID=3415136 RepID=UPI003C7DE95A